jgi:hypothetical protein
MTKPKIKIFELANYMASYENTVTLEHDINYFIQENEIISVAHVAFENNIIISILYNE